MPYENYSHDCGLQRTLPIKKYIPKNDQLQINLLQSSPEFENFNANPHASHLEANFSHHFLANLWWGILPQKIDHNLQDIHQPE